MGRAFATCRKDQPLTIRGGAAHGGGRQWSFNWFNLALVYLLFYGGTALCVWVLYTIVIAVVLDAYGAALDASEGGKSILVEVPLVARACLKRYYSSKVSAPNSG
eukprot:9341287-Pyramimonas_sp.AAC.1